MPNPGLIFEMDEFIDRHEYYDLKRDGRFLIAELQTPHQVLSTSAYRGGLYKGIRYLVNHQSCEGNGHDARFALIKQLGEVGYHRHVCTELGLPPDLVALMGTAANMNYAARVVETHAELRVCAIVTAGVAMRGVRAMGRVGTKRMLDGAISMRVRSMRWCLSIGRSRRGRWRGRW